MQLDATELETEMGGIDSDGLDAGGINSDDLNVNVNHADGHMQLDIISTGVDDGSDEEYETWGGFGSSTYLE